MPSGSKLSESLLQSMQDLMDHFGEDAPDIPAHPSEDDMMPWRQRIDILDRIMLLVMNERVHYANALGAIKKKMGLPVYFPDREAEVIRNVVDGNKGPLSDAAVRRLFERVIDETRSNERYKYQELDEDE